MTRDTLTTIDPAPEFIYTQLVGGWLHFAFIDVGIGVSQWSAYLSQCISRWYLHIT
jgi:hypothetical protein